MLTFYRYNNLKKIKSKKMNNIIKISVLTTILFVSSCATLYFGSKEIKQMEKSAKDKISMLKKRYKYVSEGWAKIEKDDISSALAQAKKLSREELALMIKTRVERIIIDELGVSTKKSYESFVSRTKLYTDILLEKPDYEEWFKFFPDKNSVTYIMCVSEETVNQWVTKDIETKLSPILGYLNSVLREIKNKNYTTALSILIKTKEVAEDKLAGMLAEVVVTEDEVFSLRTAEKRNIQGKKEELFSFINKKITEILSNVKLSCLDENITYNSEGRLNKNLRIQVAYQEKENKVPMRLLPLKSKFVSGGGTVLENFTTDEYGIAEVPITNVNPLYPETVIEIKLDEEKIGIKKEDVATLPTVFVKLTKIKTVAIYVSFVNIDKETEIADFENQLKSLLINVGCSVINSPTKDINYVRTKLYADYFLIVELKTTATGPDAFGVYTAYISGNAKIVATSDNRDLFVVSCPTGKGEHLSKTAAGRDAFSRAYKTFLKTIEEKIQNVFKQ